MRNVLAALLLFLASVSAALAQQSVNIPATMFSVPIIGGATALLASGKPGQSIFVTAVDLVPTVPATVQFIQGTGALCGTGTTNLTGSMAFTAGQTYMKGDGYGAFWILLPGNNLCITITGGPAPGSLAYAQF